MNRLKRYLPIAILVLFVVVRLPGLDVPYYQDEWKNVAASATVEGAGQFFAHPPLMQMIFVADYAIFGMEWFRALPLLFSAAALWLLFLAVRRRTGSTAGIWSMLLGSVSFYSVLGSLQPDVDGSILPFLFLVALYSYDKLKESQLFVSFPRHACRQAGGGDTGVQKNSIGKWWTILFTAALLAGMLTKLSFVIVAGVFILDWLWENRRNRLVAHIGLSAAFLGVLAVFYVALLYIIQAIYPAFDISFMLGHANQFTSEGGRGWLQIAVQSIKAVYYLSPLLIAPLIFVSRDVIVRSRPFLIYLFAGLAFYIIIFDFSQGALDKYLMFMTVPLAAICGAAISRVFSGVSFPRKRESMSDHNRMDPRFRGGDTKEPEDDTKKLWWGLGLGLIVSLAIFALNFTNPIAVPLYPKAEWFGRVFHGDWNILTPMTGGSGPMGFYVSFLFIAVSFIATLAAAIVGRVKRALVAPTMLVIMLVGIGYNAVFAEEYMAGRINGSSAKVLNGSITFIAQSGRIDKVITYNDAGNGPLTLAGKYADRFYAAPAFEQGHRAKFSSFKGHYLVVDVPRLYGFYGAFFDKCTILYHSVSKSVSGTVYDCPGAAGIVKSL